MSTATSNHQTHQLSAVQCLAMRYGPPDMLVANRMSWQVAWIGLYAIAMACGSSATKTDPATPTETQDPPIQKQNPPPATVAVEPPVAVKPPTMDAAPPADQRTVEQNVPAECIGADLKVPKSWSSFASHKCMTECEALALDRPNVAEIGSAALEVSLSPKRAKVLSGGVVDLNVNYRNRTNEKLALSLQLGCGNDDAPARAEDGSGQPVDSEGSCISHELRPTRLIRVVLTSKGRLSIPLQYKARVRTYKQPRNPYRGCKPAGTRPLKAGAYFLHVDVPPVATNMGPDDRFPSVFRIPLQVL